MEKAIEVVSKDKDGNEVTVYVRNPDDAILSDSQAEANRAFNKAVMSEAVFRDALNTLMKKQGLWSDAKQAELDAIDKKLRQGEKKLADGGFRKKAGYKIAVEMVKNRNEKFSLLARQRQMDEFTVEGQVDNHKFDFLMTQCLCDEEGNPLFKTLSDYKVHGSEPYVLDGAQELSSLVYGLDKNWQAKLPENAWLIKHGFMNSECQFINSDGEIVDAENHRIDKEGYRINKAGDRVDLEGNRIDEHGNILGDNKPLLDE